MTIFIQEQKKLKKLHYGDLNEIVLKNFPESTKECSFFFAFLP